MEAGVFEGFDHGFGVEVSGDGEGRDLGFDRGAFDARDGFDCDVHVVGAFAAAVVSVQFQLGDFAFGGAAVFLYHDLFVVALALKAGAGDGVSGGLCRGGVGGDDEHPTTVFIDDDFCAGEALGRCVDRRDAGAAADMQSGERDFDLSGERGSAENDQRKCEADGFHR